eukprot:1146042-Pelagomonas_calceolata.AAC.3
MEVRMASARSSQGGDAAAEPWSAAVRVRRTHDRNGNELVGLPEEVTVRCLVVVSVDWLEAHEEAELPHGVAVIFAPESWPSKAVPLGWSIT